MNALAKHATKTIKELLAHGTLSKPERDQLKAELKRRT